MSTVVVGGGGPRPQNAKVVSDAKGHRIEFEGGDVLASGFSDADDAQRYLDSSSAAVAPFAAEEGSCTSGNPQGLEPQTSDQLGE